MLQYRESYQDDILKVCNLRKYGFLDHVCLAVEISK